MEKWTDPTLLVAATGCLLFSLSFEFGSMGRYIFGGIAAVTYFSVSWRAFRR